LREQVNATLPPKTVAVNTRLAKYIILASSIKIVVCFFLPLSLIFIASLLPPSPLPFPCCMLNPSKHQSAEIITVPPTLNTKLRILTVSWNSRSKQRLSPSTVLTRFSLEWRYTVCLRRARFVIFKYLDNFKLQLVKLFFLLFPCSFLIFVYAFLTRRGTFSSYSDNEYSTFLKKVDTHLPDRMVLQSVSPQYAFYYKTPL
jgi:hypothetical protein